MTADEEILLLKACIGTIRQTLGLPPENIDARHAERYTREVGKVVSEHSRNRRWNIERTDDGGFRVCYGEHERAQGCDWQHFVPARVDVPA